MKKRLVIVGNKTDIEDISAAVDSFDTVVRINRMNNFGTTTGVKTDLLLADITDNFLKLVKQPYGKFVTAKKLILNTSAYSLKNVQTAVKNGIFTLEQMKNAERVNLDRFTRSNIPWSSHSRKCIPTNFFKVLKYCLKNYSSKYGIWVAGVDINDRGMILNKSDVWKVWHHDAGFYEQEELIKLANTKKINIL